MKQIIALLLLPLLTIAFVSCKKDNKGEEENGKPTKLLKTIKISDTESGNLQYLLTHYYDNQNRLIKVGINALYSSNPDIQSDFYNITYSTNTITITDFENHVYILQLDDNGYVIGYNGQYTYIYENGYLKEVKGENGRRTEYSWVNGNMVQSTHYKDSTSFISYYEYNNRENLLNINDITGLIYDYETFEDGLRLKGCTSKNYLVKASQLTFNYQFDADGFPTQMMRTIGGLGDHTYKYTYY
jgi:hypothetical protein